MATVHPNVQPAPPAAVETTVEIPEVRIYSHSPLFYWWPVWVTGFILALVTRLGGEHIEIGHYEVWIHPSKNLGVFFALVLFLVILISNVTVRGQASVIVVLTLLFVTVLFAYLGWWEIILGWLPNLALYLNLGFYVFFSCLVFLAWFVSVFVHDRLTYWCLRPGQLTEVHVIGGAEKSYDTRGMVFEKALSDLFRHKILGLGSGDIRIIATGARREDFVVPNVLFVNKRLAAMQALVAEKPTQAEHVVQTTV